MGEKKTLPVMSASVTQRGLKITEDLSKLYVSKVGVEVSESRGGAGGQFLLKVGGHGLLSSIFCETLSPPPHWQRTASYDTVPWVQGVRVIHRDLDE